MIEFVQATKADVLSVYPQSPQCAAAALSYGRDVFERDLIPLEDRAIAIRDGGRSVGVYGLVEMWPGVARVWALFSEALLKDHPRLLSLHVKRDFERAFQLGFHRIEATAGADHRAGCEFLSWLGFAREGLMRRYSLTGEDMVLYARVCDEL